MEEGKVIYDYKTGVVTVRVNPMLYSQNTVMRAAYRFLDDFDVIVDGDPLSELSVTIKVRRGDDFERDDLSDISDRFYSELIHASVEDLQARRYADTRNALIGAALKSMLPGIAQNADERNVLRDVHETMSGGKCECEGKAQKNQD